MANINIKDEASVNKWKADCLDLNEKAKQLIDHATQVVKDLTEMAEGNFFNKVIEYADQVVQGVTKIMEGMKQILDAVTSIVSKAKEVIADITEGVVGVIGKIIG